MPPTHYSYGRIIFSPERFADMQRETRDGFSMGRARIEGLNEWSGAMEIDIQNENLIARVNGEGPCHRAGPDLHQWIPKRPSDHHGTSCARASASP